MPRLPANKVQLQLQGRVPKTNRILELLLLVHLIHIKHENGNENEVKGWCPVTAQTEEGRCHIHPSYKPKLFLGLIASEGMLLDNICPLLENLIKARLSYKLNKREKKWIGVAQQWKLTRGACLHGDRLLGETHIQWMLPANTAAQDYHNEILWQRTGEDDWLSDSNLQNLYAKMWVRGH